jgi:hypothetical protein
MASHLGWVALEIYRRDIRPKLRNRYRLRWDRHLARSNST